MKKFHYEWWTVEVLEQTGRTTWEIKAKSKENAIRQINSTVKSKIRERKINRCRYG